VLLLPGVFGATFNVFQKDPYSNGIQNCNITTLEFEIDSEDKLYVGTVLMNSNSLKYKYLDAGSGFFSQDNLYRLRRKNIEFFDMTPTSNHGLASINIYGEKYDSPDIGPGSYTLEFYPVFEDRTNIILDVNPINYTLVIKSKIKDLDIYTTDFYNRTNTVVMGDLLDLHVDNVINGLYSTTAQIYSDYTLGVRYDTNTINISEFEDNVYPENVDTILGDLEEYLVCPKEDINLTISDQCFSKSILVSQEVPTPSNIYLWVDRFFSDYDNDIIPRIYYKVGAYFNCMDSGASFDFYVNPIV
jgi:hypothetical protein